ncbi:MAG: 2-oxoacid:acceptor oxidoreductase subunit alpha [Elusimicrobiota bacterium]
MKLNRDISIVLSGAAGQGIQTVENLLVHAFKETGYNVFSTKEFMSRVRGGNNTTQIRVSAKPVRAYVEKIDILLPLNPGALDRIEDWINSETLIIGDPENIDEEYADRKHTFKTNISESAREIGGLIFANTVAAGIVEGLVEVKEAIAEQSITEKFSSKGKDIVQKNKKAVSRGFDIASDIFEKMDLTVNIEKTSSISDNILMNGVEAVGIGALLGGCNFISAYPMSPSTGVFVFLCEQAGEFGIVAEQAEDEISAVNMNIGAWYAGARALANTSGGGVALMEEGISLAGMTETPLVVHVAQRPGPATGLPTRTAQEDLNLVLHAGHGEFPRAIYAPGSFQQALNVVNRAFNTADKYQTPVFVLTDQYFLDSYMNVSKLDTDKLKVKKAIEKTSEDYSRYKLKPDGISPRGVPGYGDGLVCADSDEHGEKGHITEDLDFREKINEKRLEKLEGLKDETIEPELYGPEDYETLIIGWGSNYHVIKEALKKTGSQKTAFLHFSQVYPVPRSTEEYLNKAKITAVVENNATGQFAGLIKKETGIAVDEKILKYNGLAFSVEELVEKFKNLS